jgi:hypothetical protein
VLLASVTNVVTEDALLSETVQVVLAKLLKVEGEQAM